MATNPNRIDTKGGATASPTVVRLPTAAKRKVENFGNHDQAQAAMRKQHGEPWPGEYIFPSERVAMKTAERVLSLPLTPELVVLRAMLATMDLASHAKVTAHIAEQVLGHGGTIDTEMVALDFVRLCKPITYGEQHDLERAFDRLAAEADH